MALLRLILVSAFASMLALSAYAQSAAEKFGTMPETWEATISPDGRHLALGCSPTGVRAICIYELDSDARPRLITPPEDGRIEGLRWVSDQYLLYVAEVFDTVGTSSGLVEVNLRRLVSYNLKTSKSEILMRNVGAFVSLTKIDSLLVEEPDRIMMAVSYRNDETRVTGSRLDRGVSSGQHIIYKVNLKNGKARPSAQFTTQVFDTVHDAKGNRLAEIERDFKAQTFKLFSTLEGRTLIYEQGDVQLAPFVVDGLSEDQTSLIVRFDDGERFGLHTLSLKDGSIDPVLFDGRPLGNVATLDDPFTNEVIGYSYTDDLPGWIYLNEDFAKVEAFTRNALKADRVFLNSWTRDRSQFTLAAYKRGQPATYYIYDTRTPSLSPLGGEAPWLSETDVGPVETVSYAARDGLEIEAFLTYPPGQSVSNGALPLVMLPHGGPESRDTAAYDWLAQAIASQGYLVMQPNFRGSSGYGRKFRDAGYGEFGGKMIEDIIDGASWAVSEGRATSGYCALGWSYGGYASLMTGLKDPENAKCLISINGVTNVNMVFQGRDQRSSAFAYWENYIGDVFKTDASKRAAISPQSRSDEYTVPILLLHGDEDTTVPVDQSRILYQRLNKSTGSQLVIFKGDDHQLARTASRIMVLDEALGFLTAHHPAR